MEKNELVPLDSTTRYGLIILAVAQGYALYFLHLALDAAAWPATDLRWLKALYTVAIGLPAFFYLSTERIQEKRNLFTALALGVVLFLLGWHLGWVESVKGLSGHGQVDFTFPFVVSLTTALFILAFFFRTWSITGSLHLHYSHLLTYSWQHALTLGLLGLFIGVFWLLLLLWAALFDAIGVSFFKDLFEERAFAYPVTWLVLGLGLVLIRNRIGLVGTVQFMCEALIKALLPLAAAIVLLFLAALPFTGVQPVWDTGSAAVMMMTLTLVLLFFFNAVLSGNPQQSVYPQPLRWFVVATVALLPITTSLAIWALWLRVAQYGLTPDRLWAAVVLLLTAAYTLTYAVLIMWKRNEALNSIRTANTWLALLIVCVLILVNTPVADLRDWSAQSQAKRLLNGKVSPDEFDYAFMRFSLGAYGVRALENIRHSTFVDEHPEVAKRIDAVMKQEHRYSRTPIVDTDDVAAVVELLRIRPEVEPVPDALVKHIANTQPQCLNGSNVCDVVKTFDSSDGAQWLVLENRRGGCAHGTAYTEWQGEWLAMGGIHSPGCCEDAEDKGADAVPVRVPGPFLAYHLNECIYAVSPSEAFLKRLQAAP